MVGSMMRPSTAKQMCVAALAIIAGFLLVPVKATTGGLLPGPTTPRYALYRVKYEKQNLKALTESFFDEYDKLSNADKEVKKAAKHLERAKNDWKAMLIEPCDKTSQEYKEKETIMKDCYAALASATDKADLRKNMFECVVVQHASGLLAVLIQESDNQQRKIDEIEKNLQQLDTAAKFLADADKVFTTSYFILQDAKKFYDMAQNRMSCVKVWRKRHMFHENWRVHCCAVLPKAKKSGGQARLHLLLAQTNAQ